MEDKNEKTEGLQIGYKNHPVGMALHILTLITLAGWIALLAWLSIQVRCLLLLLSFSGAYNVDQYLHNHTVFVCVLLSFRVATTNTTDTTTTNSTTRWTGARR
jgi:uncharacterized membrane protein